MVEQVTAAVAAPSIADRPTWRIERQERRLCASLNRAENSSSTLASIRKCSANMMVTVVRDQNFQCILFEVLKGYCLGQLQ